MWHFYAELLVLVAVAFLAGSALGAIGVRIFVRKADPKDVAPPAAPDGGAAT